MPPVSLSMEEIKVLQWFVDDGSFVRTGDKLLEVETDKTVVEMEAPGEGVLHIKADANAVVEADTVLGEVLPPGVADTRVASTSVSKPRLTSKPAIIAKTPARGTSSPAARRLAAKHDVDLREVVGSGPGGRIVAGDIELLIGN